MRHKPKPAERTRAHALRPPFATFLTSLALLLCATAGGAQKLPHVILRTDLGEIEIEVDSARAPITAANFLRYVDAGSYQGGRFFRVVREDNQPNDSVRIKVVQGDISSAQAAGRFPAIALERTSVTGLRHRDGTVSMARGGPDTATSSFFICIGDQPALDAGGHRNLDGQGFAAFARVVRGMDVVRRINQGSASGQQLAVPVMIQEARRAAKGTD